MTMMVAQLSLEAEKLKNLGRDATWTRLMTQQSYCGQGPPTLRDVRLISTPRAASHKAEKRTTRSCIANTMHSAA